MEISLSAKPQTLLVSCIPLASSRFSSHFYLLTSVRTDFLGSRIRSRPFYLHSRRRCRNLGFRTQSPRCFFGGSVTEKSLFLAVAIAIANVAAIRFFYSSYVKRKKESEELSGTLDHVAHESLSFPEQDRGVSGLVDSESSPGNLKNFYVDNLMTEGDVTFEENGMDMLGKNRHNWDKREVNLSGYQSTALEHKESVIAKTSEKAASEDSASGCNDTGSTNIGVGMVLSIPSEVLNEAGVPQSHNFVVDMPELLLRHQNGALKDNEVGGIEVDPASSLSAVPMKDTYPEGNEDNEQNHRVAEKGEHQGLNFNGLSQFVKEELHTFYEENPSALSSMSPLEARITLSPHSHVEEKHSSSSIRRHNSLNGAALLVKDSSNSTVHLEAGSPLAFYNKGTGSNRKVPTKPSAFSRNTRRRSHQISNKGLARIPQPNGVHVKDENDPSDYLSTYNRLLRDGRLIDCIELLESLERKGLLDMDKVYHARFLKTCQSQKAVKEAFRFTKLVKNPTLSTFNLLLSVCASSQDSEGAFKVLQLVNEAGLKADCKLYTTLISTCAKSGKVDAMFEVFHEMVNAGVEPNVHTYGALIDGCAKAGQVAKAFGAYGIMRSKKVKPDRVIFNALIAACGQSGAVDRAFDVLAEMKAEAQPIDPDHVTVGALMKTCAEAGQIDRAQEVYKMMDQYKIKGTPDVYTIAVNSCSQMGDLEFALRVHSDMKKNGVAPDEMFLSALIDVAGHAGKVDFAFEILQDARLQGVQLGNISYSSLMGACSNARNWQKAVELYDNIKALNLLPTVSTLNALITSLCDGDQLQKAVEVLAEIKGAGVSPNAITYSILFVACEKTDELELGFKILSEAKRDGVVPYLIMCKCLTGMSLRRFEKASALGEPILSFSSEKPQIDNNWTSRAIMVYRETIAAGIVPSVEVLSQVLGCLQLPRETSFRNRLVENLGVTTDASRRPNLYSLLDGFGEYDPRSFSLLEEAASLGIVPYVSFNESPIIIDARKLDIPIAEVYLLKVLKALKHRLAAGAKLPNITILVAVEKTRVASPKGDKTVNLAGRTGQAITALLRRLKLPYQGKESVGKIRISGLVLKRWFQPKLSSPFGGKRGEANSLQNSLGKGVADQQRSIRTSDFSI